MIARRTFIASLLLTVVGFTAISARAAETRPLNIVVLVGGHGFDTKAFPKLFEGYDDVKVTIVNLKDHSEVFEKISDWKYDVIVMYNMTQKISETRRANFLKLLDKGVGLVVLHHAFANYQDWPEFAKIAGVRYNLKPGEFNGQKVQGSGYKHDVKIKVKVADASHPVTQGLKDFEILDETYIRQWFDAEAKVLLTTDEPTSDKTLALVKTHAKSRVCSIQLGHGPNGYTDPNYRQLVVQAIRWTAGK